MASMRAMSYGMPASRAMARVWRMVLVEPPMATSSMRALSKASTVAMSRGLRSRSTSLTIGAGGAVVEGLALLRDGEDGAVAGQRHAEGLAEAVHRVGREHARSRSRRWGRRSVRASSTAPR